MECESCVHVFSGLCFQKGMENRELGRMESMNSRDSVGGGGGKGRGARGYSIFQGVIKKKAISTGSLGTLTQRACFPKNPQRRKSMREISTLSKESK